MSGAKKLFFCCFRNFWRRFYALPSLSQISLFWRPDRVEINFDRFLTEKMIFLRNKLHHDSMLPRDIWWTKYEENWWMHLCRPMFDIHRYSLLSVSKFQWHLLRDFWFLHLLVTCRNGYICLRADKRKSLVIVLVCELPLISLFQA